MRNTWEYNWKRAQARALPTQRVWVTAYALTRSYGGPEEGGWWYDHAEPLETVHCRRGGSDEVVARLAKAHSPYLPGGSISSVLGGYEIHVRVETVYQQFGKRATPRWE